jgi:hypothetical protein
MKGAAGTLNTVNTLDHRRPHLREKPSDVSHRGGGSSSNAVRPSKCGCCSPSWLVESGDKPRQARNYPGVEEFLAVGRRGRGAAIHCRAAPTSPNCR